jgi:hypothetical protein
MNIQLVDMAKDSIRQITEDPTAGPAQVRAALEEIEMDIIDRLEALDDYDETLLVDDDD